MKIKIVKVGKSAAKEIHSLVEVYQKRLRAFCPVELIELKQFLPSTSKKQNNVSGTDMLVVLDEKGKIWSSRELAQKIVTWQKDPRIKSVVFLIGDPYGLDESVKKQASEIWSLSHATFPTDLAWLLVWEQIYRAFTILKGTGYHHE